MPMASAQRRGFWVTMIEHGDARRLAGGQEAEHDHY
jgi:hypothetical protein